MSKRRWMQARNSQQCSSNSGSSSSQSSGCKRRGRTWGSRGSRRQVRQQNPPLLRDEPTAVKLSGVLTQLQGEGAWPRGLASPGYFDDYLPSSGCIHHDWSRDVLLHSTQAPEPPSAPAPCDVPLGPPNTTPLSLTREPAQSPAQTTPVLVSFRIQKHTAFGQRVCIVGDCKELGGWALAESASLEWSDGHWWHAAVRLPPGTHEFKAVVLADCNAGAPVWETGANRILEVPAPATADSLTYMAHWQQPPHPTTAPLPPAPAPQPTPAAPPTPSPPPLQPDRTRTYSAALHSLALFSAPPPTTLDIGAADWQPPPPPGSTPADLLLLMLEAARLSRHPAVITRHDADFVRGLGLGTCNLAPLGPPPPKGTPTAAATPSKLPPRHPRGHQGQPAPASHLSPHPSQDAGVATAAGEPFKSPLASLQVKKPGTMTAAAAAAGAAPWPPALPVGQAADRLASPPQRPRPCSVRGGAPTPLNPSLANPAAAGPRRPVPLSPGRPAKRATLLSGATRSLSGPRSHTLPGQHSRMRVASEAVASTMRRLAASGDGACADDAPPAHTIGPLSDLEDTGGLLPEHVPGGCDAELCRSLLGAECGGAPLQHAPVAGTSLGSLDADGSALGCAFGGDGAQVAGAGGWGGRAQVAARLVAEHLGLGGRVLSAGDEERLAMVMESFGSLAGSGFVPQHVGPMQYSSWLVRRGGGAAAGVWHAAVKCALAPLVE